MDIREKAKILNGIIDNEFNHIQDEKEVLFANNSNVQKALANEVERLMQEFGKRLSNEDYDLLDDLECALVSQWTNLCRFYFKEGIEAGVKSLKFIGDTDLKQAFVWEDSDDKSTSKI